MGSIVVFFSKRKKSFVSIKKEPKHRQTQNNNNLLKEMRKICLLIIIICATCAHAQVSAIVGDWKTVDDKTGEQRSIVTIYKGSDGLYYGKISKLLMYQELDLKCEACHGEDKNAPIEGLVIIRGMKAEEGQLVGGKVLDPESGKFYYGKIYLKNGKLVLRGSLDKRGFIGRNQEWIR